MAKKDYLNLGQLTQYDEKIKSVIVEGDKIVTDIANSKMDKFETMTWGQLCGKTTAE